MEKEIWKSIKDCENFYEVSNLGNIRSVTRIIHTSKGSREYKGKLLKGGISSNGYLTINIAIKGKVINRTIHTLVAEAFLGYNKTGYTEVVDHIDNNKLNNTLINLKLTTNRSNTSRGMSRGVSKYIGVNYITSKNKKGTPVLLPWRASIYFKGKRHTLGRFNTEIEAHNAYVTKLNEINTTQCLNH